MHLIDTHVHLNFESFQPDLAAVAQNWRDAGVKRLVHSCVEPAEFPQIQALADRFPELSFAIGLHPLDMDKWTEELAGQIFDLAKSDARVVAIGETGLDFYKAEDHERQKAAFESQLAIAQQLDLPVIIHCRDAASAMVDLLQTFWQARGAVKGVMNCWSGLRKLTRRASTARS